MSQILALKEYLNLSKKQNTKKQKQKMRSIKCFITYHELPKRSDRFSLYSHFSSEAALTMIAKAIVACL
jgi:hypothetical protein